MKKALMFTGLFLLEVLSSTHSWRNVGSAWQISDIENPIVQHRSLTSDQCPVDMMYVSGQMKQNDPHKGSVEALQLTTCLKFLDGFDENGLPKFPERCQSFDKEKWEKISSTLTTKPINVCIDKFEFPNIPGVYPVIAVDYYESQALCVSKHKRLCFEDEWTFACEGPDALPYPYGYVRDSTKCNIDKPWRLFDANKLIQRKSTVARDELAKLWQGEASGMRPHCHSVFGVYDQTGNIDEFVTTINPRPFQSVLTGGYWGPVRARCRPKTTVHNEGHFFYQQGFRCCATPT